MSAFSVAEQELIWPKLEPSQRVRVKICGLTSEADAEAAIAAGADALGFNTWTGSKRYVDLSVAQEWIRRLPGFVTRVALCVNASQNEAQAFAAMSCVDVVQFHGNESREYCREFSAAGHSFIRAVRLGTDGDLVGLRGWGTRQVLVDAAVAGAFGGTGECIEKRLAGQAIQQHPDLALTLAGGLDADNVGAFVRELRPYAVDVASGVESGPGRKDREKMRDFVQAVRACDLFGGAASV